MDIMLITRQINTSVLQLKEDKGSCKLHNVEYYCHALLHYAKQSFSIGVFLHETK